jgi:peptide deformylase
VSTEILPNTIVRYPDPRLRTRCEPIETFDGELAGLARRMLEIMKKGDGVGLAGPQVGVCRRIFVCNPTGKPEDDQVFVNPELSDLTGSEEGDEGCLSLPEVRVRVRRARRCRMKAFDLNGQPIDRLGEDLVARIWQHETDHLDGGLIIDRMDGTDKIANKKLLAQLEADYQKTRNG